MLAITEELDIMWVSCLNVFLSSAIRSEFDAGSRFGHLGRSNNQSFIEAAKG